MTISTKMSKVALESWNEMPLDCPAARSAAMILAVMQYVPMII
jgi:hypothetical protein